MLIHRVYFSWLFVFSHVVFSRAADQAVGLRDYRLDRGPILIRGVRANASGLTYHADRDTLFCVLNSPQRVLELGLDGRVLRFIKLKDFRDTEGICWTGGNRFAVAEERRGTINLVEIGLSATSVKRSKREAIALNVRTDAANGIEGVAFDLKSRRFFAAREKNAVSLYKIIPQKSATGGDPIVTLMGLAGRGLKDLAGLHFDSASGRLFLLSHESARVIETNRYGLEKSRLSLRAGSAGLKKTIPQAEGIAMDKRGSLYIVSEPNLLYIFKKTSSE